MNPCTVVCPLSSFAGAERALPTAYDAAAALSARLQLFSAVEDPHMTGRRTEYLQQVAARTRPPTAELANVDVIVDPHAPRALGRLAASPGVVTVMATSSVPLMHTGYVGSAAERVAREARNPAVLVGPHATVRLNDVERVVVPCDGSDLSEVVLKDAAAWAQRLDVELWVVTAISPRQQRQDGYSADAESNYIRRIAEGIGADWDVLHGVDPAKTIVDWAGPSLIAMTTHGRSGIARVTVGSVAVGVTRRSIAPVLVANSRARAGQH